MKMISKLSVVPLFWSCKGRYPTSALLFALLVFPVIMFIPSGDALALSQWAKKYGMSCNTCHTAFPRLTYMGEKFMRDGYQFNQDGNSKKQKVGDRLVLDELKHLFGIRLNLRPVEYTTNGIDEDGDREDHLTFGKTNWVQFFVGGTIYKNTSIFIEYEVNDEDESHFSWYKLIFTNLFGPQGAANLVLGQQAPMEWMPASGRLRVMPDREGLAWGPRSSAGADPTVNDPEDEVGITGARPGISFYGYQGPLVYFAGVSPGDEAGGNDLNNEINTWLGARFDLTGGTFAGSAVGVFAMQGTDAANTAGTPVTVPPAPFQTTNDWDRLSLQGVLRMGGLDLTAGLTSGEDDNWTLEAVDVSQEFDSTFAQLGYLFGSNKQYYATLRHQSLEYDDSAVAAAYGVQDEQEQLAASLYYFPMENLKIGLNVLLDETDYNNPLTEEEDVYHITIRTMF